MYLEDTRGKNYRGDKIRVSCDECPEEFVRNFLTAQRQLKDYGKHLCKECLKRYRSDRRTHIGICHKCGSENPVSESALNQNLRDHNGVFLCRSCAAMGNIVSEETRQKLRERFAGKPLSEEHKKKISETLRANKHGPTEACLRAPNRRNKGTKITEEHREILREYHTGKIVREATKEKISKARIELLEKQGGLLPATREKLSKKSVKQYQENPNFNKRFKSGSIESSKCPPSVFYRSSYEKYFIEQFLEKDPAVLTYEGENSGIVIAYEYRICI